MIKFFRKIRYDLMEKNKTGKYFKYAIGEIILVVIGILIALQINDWNETAKQQINADNLVVRLKQQVILNLDRCDNRLKRTDKKVKSMKRLMSVMGKPTESMNSITLDSLIDDSNIDHHLSLDLNTLTEALDNGQIETIKSVPLRASLYRLARSVIDIETREKVANADNLNFMFPYLNRNMNVRNWTVNTDEVYRNEIGYSALEGTDYTKMLNDREFENLLDTRIFYGKEMLLTYKK